MTSRGDNRKLMGYLARKGYRVSRGFNGHWKIYEGERLIAVTSGTPSDWRSRRNFLRDLRNRTRA